MLLKENALARAEPGRSRLYKAGGWALVAVGALYGIGASLSLLIGGAPGNSEAYLAALGRHPSLSTANSLAFSLAHLLLIPAVAALYFALRPVNRSAMLAAVTLFGLFIAVDVVVTETTSISLVGLARSYAAAATPAEQAAYVAVAAQRFSVLAPATLFSYVVSSTGVLIAAIVMLKGVFPRLTAIIGVVAAAERIVGGFYVFYSPLSVLLVPCLVAFVLWCIATAIALLELARRTPQTAPPCPDG